MEGKRVAVVGSGISGLSAAWLLHRWGTLVAPSPGGLQAAPATRRSATGKCAKLDALPGA